MEKYRIVSKNPSDRNRTSWHIERKKFWGWRTIMIKENNTRKPLTFNSMADAEYYMYCFYFKNGEVYQPNLNEFWYEPFTYYL